MLVLAVDTATPDLVVGVVSTESGKTVAQAFLPHVKGHNEVLVPTINQVLGEAECDYSDLGGIVTGAGPGPFTGLRVGMVTAAAIGHARGIPVWGVCTHDAIAATMKPAGTALVATDARRREIYWATYTDGVRTSGPDVARPGNLETELCDQAIISAQLAAQLPVTWQDIPVSEPELSAAGLVAVADLDTAPAPVEPLYLRRPDAVPPRQQPKSSAIPDVVL